MTKWTLNEPSMTESILTVPLSLHRTLLQDVVTPFRTPNQSIHRETLISMVDSYIEHFTQPVINSLFSGIILEGSGHVVKHNLLLSALWPGAFFPDFIETNSHKWHAAIEIQGGQEIFLQVDSNKSSFCILVQ